MRPIVSDQNSLRNPLNELLGTQAQVRLLRVLANEVDGSLTAVNAAEHAGLTIPGAHKALKRLAQSGFVVRVGGGRKHQYELCRSDKLVSAIAELFQSEKERYEDLLSAIKGKLEKLVPYAHAAWIQDFPDEFGDPMILGLLHETKHLSDYIQRLQKQLYQVERDFDLTIEVNGYTKADLPDLEADKVTPLYGVLPFPEEYSRKMYATPLTHAQKDQQMLKLSRKLAKAIDLDTSLVRRAKEHVQRMLKSDHGSATKDIEEWRHILESYSIRRLLQFLISTSQRANRLRQSNPLFAILTIEERSRFLKGLGGSQ
jgi:DNA-binding MarR family transcriptional regulator/phage terminase Nu1 subunit (DNA packaging protein)